MKTDVGQKQKGQRKRKEEAARTGNFANPPRRGLGSQALLAPVGVERRARRLGEGRARGWAH